MQEVLGMLKSPEFYAAVLALVVAVRGVGELFIAIGSLNTKEDWFDSAGGFLLKLCDKVGKSLAWLGIGNKK